MSPAELFAETQMFKTFQLQTTHNLTQALQIGLKNSLTTVIKDAAYHLVESIGNYDAHSCVQMLALFQVI